MQTSAGPLRSQCGICSKRFRDNYKLKRHMVVHTKEKNYVCQLCHKSYGQPDDLKRHIKDKHSETASLQPKRSYSHGNIFKI